MADTVEKIYGTGIILTISIFVSLFSYFFSSSSTSGKVSSVIISTFKNNIQTDSNKFLLLSIFLGIIYVGYYINILSHKIFLNDVKEKFFVEDFIKLGVYMTLLFFVFDGEKLMSSFFNYSIFENINFYYFLLTIILTFLHPLFEKLSKQAGGGYHSVLLTGQSLDWKKPKVWILISLLLLTLIITLTNRNYEVSTNSFFGSYKYLLVLMTVLFQLLYGLYKEKKVNYWFYGYLINMLINPNYSLFNGLVNSIFFSYYIHSPKKVGYNIFSD